MCRLRGWEAASAQCPLGESAVTCHGEANRRTAHRAKSASSDRSGFFRFEVFEAGAGASVGGEGRSGTVSAALARSSRNLSNSSLVTPSSRSSPFRSVLSHTSMSSMTEGCATGIYEGRGGKQRAGSGRPPHSQAKEDRTPEQSKSSKVTPKQNQNVHRAKQLHGTHRQHRQLYVKWRVRRAMSW